MEQDGDPAGSLAFPGLGGPQAFPGPAGALASPYYEGKGLGSESPEISDVARSKPT